MFFKKRKEEQRRYIKELEHEQEKKIFNWLDKLGREKIKYLKIEHSEHTYENHCKQIESFVSGILESYEDRDFLAECFDVNNTRYHFVANASYDEYQLKKADKRFLEHKISVIDYSHFILACKDNNWIKEIVVDEYLKNKKINKNEE